MKNQELAFTSNDYCKNINDNWILFHFIGGLLAYLEVSPKEFERGQKARDVKRSNANKVENIKTAFKRLKKTLLKFLYFVTSVEKIVFKIDYNAQTMPYQNQISTILTLLKLGQDLVIN